MTHHVDSFADLGKLKRLLEEHTSKPLGLATALATVRRIAAERESVEEDENKRAALRKLQSALIGAIETASTT